MSTLTKPALDNGQRGRGRPRDEDARTRLLHAALRVLEENGYDNTTTDAITERAGASKATLYRWWPNKAALLVESLREAVAQELPFPDTGDLHTDIRLQLRNFAELITGKRSRIFKTFVGAAQSDPEVAEAFETVWRRPRRETARQGLARHRDKMRDDVDLDHVMDLMYGPLYYCLLIGRGPITSEYTDSLAEMIVRSVRER